MWLDELEGRVRGGDLRIADTSRWQPSTWPATARGWGTMEAPRDALAHWISIENAAITNHQLVVPSTWNGSPRDADGRRGAWEQALIDTPCRRSGRRERIEIEIEP